MTHTHGLQWRATLAAAAAGVLIGARVAAVSLVVGDVDARSLAAGAEVSVPVMVQGLTPGTFAGFQFALDYDPAVLGFSAASRGGLIGMADASLAASGYTPNLWALETRAAEGRVKVAGAIVLEGVTLSLGNLGRLQAARVPTAAGTLVTLSFTLLQATASPLHLTPAGTFDPLLIDDPFAPGTPSSTSAPASLVDAGVILTGLPNWWQLAHFGSTGVDPAADPDHDQFGNEDEYTQGFDPNLPDVLLAVLQGWNLLALPVTPTTPAADQVFADSRRGTVIDGSPFKWVPAADDGSYTTATTLAAQTGYWVHRTPAPAATVHVTGTFGDGTVALLAGWNLVGPRTAVAVPADAGLFWWWDATTQTYRWADATRGELLSPTHGYWVYAAQDRTLALGR